MKPPIPAPEPEQDVASFRISIPVIAWPVFFGILLGVLLLVAPIMSSGLTRWKNEAAAAVLIFDLAFSWIYAAVAVQFFRVRLDEQQLSGHSFWGRAQTIAWREIQSVQRANFCGFRYLKLSTSAQKDLIWLPLSLADRDGFLRAAQKFAAPDNPLRKYLEQA